MERTKYTPKRLLSLLLALIMLFGMLPTAVFAAEPEEGPVVEPYSFTKDGLTFEFTPELRTGVHVLGQCFTNVHWTIKKAVDNVVVTEITSFWKFEGDGVPAVQQFSCKASDTQFEGRTYTLSDGMTKAFTPGVEIASGTFENVSGYHNADGTANYYLSVAGTWYGPAVEGAQYIISDTASYVSITFTARNFPLGYAVTYNGGFSGAVGVPEGAFRTTGSSATEQSFTISDVTPTLAGCTFKGWSSNEWKKTDENGNGLTGDAALFQPGEPVSNVKNNTVLTAVWEPTEAANTHTVSFVADVTGVSQLPDAIIVPEGEKVSDVTNPNDLVKPIREGYNFLHWTDDLTTKAEYNFTQKITADVKLYPVWTRNQVKITWPTSTPAGVELTHPGTGNPTDTVTSVDLGKEVTLRIVLDERYEIGTVTAGDRVLGSTVNGNIYTYTFTADKDLTVAVGAPTVKKFTISLPQGDGYEATFTDCKAYDATGFGSADLEEAEGATSYTFEYGESFKIKLEAYADTTATLRVDGTKVFEVDGNSDEPKITPTAYVVNKMYNITIGTKRKITRMVTFSLEPYGGLYTIMPVENGSKIYAPAKPEIPGYEFGGWYQDAKFTKEWKFLPDQGATLTDEEKKEQTNAADVVKGNIVIYGQLTALTYDVTYNANLPANTDATVTVPGKQTKTHGEALTLVGEPTALTGYTFKGWATSADGPVAYQPGGQYLNDAPVTLYAVWEKLTYTVTISAGTGYSTVPSGTATVEWGETFTLAIKVDASHSSKTPTIKYTSTEGGVTSAEVEVVGDSTATELQWTSGHPTPAKPTTWYYKIENVHKDYSISISIDPNDIYPVSFYAVLGDGNAQNGTKESAPFLIQSVEHGYYASMPAAPEREGYKFDHWERDNVANTEVFSTQITAATEIRAVYKAIVPKITVVKVKDANNGWELKNWQAIGKKLISFTPSDNKPYPISYGDDVTFDLVIQPGYDYSKLSVSANGYELGRENIKTDDKGVTTISFRLVYVTANTRITVSGIERKTITVTYNENALDHVSNLPAPQTANYYIHGDGNNTNFTNQVPVRNGYTFLGWSTVGNVSAEAFKKATEGPMTDANAKKYFKIDTIKTPGVEIPFTKDTTVYAIWEAQKSTVTLTFGDTALKDRTGDDGKKYDIQYEGKTFTLNAEFNSHVKGTAIFYVGKSEDFTKAEKLGEVAVNGKTASYSTSADKYLTPADQHFRYYWVEFQSEKVEGYTDCEAGPIKLKIFSRAITWTPLGEGNKDTLTIKDANGGSAQAMTAGQTYTLTVNTGKITGLECVKPNDAPVLGKHYKIVWQYKKTATSDWETVPGEFTDTNEYQVTPEESGYEFRAKIYPMGELYNKAVKFENNAYVANQYDVCLYTNTTKSVKEETKIALTTDAKDEANTVVIKNGTPFKTLGDGSHKAQYEGQTITLTAKVTKEGTQTGVESGSVEFYQKKGNDWTLIATVPVQPEGQNTGVAAAEATMSAYTDPVAEAKDEFYAKYVPNETYEASTTKTTPLMVYIKSAQLQIPVIADADKPTAHKGYWFNGATKVPSEDADKTETTYLYHLGGLMAGIPHTFELKKTAYADGATADYSVVALDGRAVPADMYTMKWETLTDANWKTTTTTGTTYTAETTKVGDRYHILLTGAKNSPFEGSEAVSKDIAIGDPQGVTVTVEAIDVIKATEVDRNNGKYPDVYQLNEITLTATVEAAEAGADRKPTGTVAFYYVDEDGKFQPLGEAELIKDKSGKMVAQITTDELPVETQTKANTKLDSVITAVYYGDETFKPSENWDEANKKVTNAEVKDAADKYLVKSDTVTVYSSVVYNCKDENKKQEACSEKGIHIKVEDGVFKANEQNVVLKLSDIYTLDRELGENLLDIIAKLTPGMDYTIQWQKLNNANAFSDKDGADFTDSKHWQDIADATGVTVVLGTVEQNTAYRAVITVKDQPITKGSYTKVKQAVEGRQVYYSNILMPTDASITMSVMVNTDKNGENLEGITEGETVTANVFLSGVTGSVPNAEIEVRIEADAAKGNDKNYAKSFTKATVNGWNSIDWDTKDVEPGFYTMKITAKTNTGYATKIFERSIIVRESSYDFNIGNQTTTYNGQTQGVTVTLNGFDFKGSDINEAAKKSWTVKYYKGEVKPENLVEPSQAGTYKAVVTLPGSAYWTEHSETVDFTISKRSVSIADAVAQAKVYDNSTDVNIVEVILNDATTAQDSTGLPTNNIGIINGDSIYAVVTGAKLSQADAGERYFEINKDFSKVDLLGDDAKNYKWDEATYTENIYVSRSQVYGETGTLKLKKGEDFPADQVIKMIDQAGNKLEANKGYTLTFYYHSDTEIKQTNDLSKTGLYTVVARPNQANYKSGVTMKFEVVNDATTYTPAAEPKPSTLITISNTAELYGNTGNTGVQTSFTNSATLFKIEYQNGANWTKTRPTDAGRYLLKVTATTGDVAYGIYTITKAHPSISITAAEATYNSMPYTGAATDLTKATENPEHYLTYAGDVAIGYYATEADQKNGNVAEQAPVDAGDYVVTLHVNETQNYTAHEVSAPFVINKAPLTIQADSRKTTQYDAFPTMTATYDGLAAETNDGTPDTSLRDVQIAPEFIYNPTNDKPNYSNATLDQVGKVAVQPIDALAKNYKLSYGDGEYVKSETESNPDLEILGLPQSGEKDSTGNKYVAKVYYGDEIQLYPYGNYTKWANGSSELTWSIENAQVTDGHGSFSIGEKTGILKVDAIGTFTVKLTRGEGEQKIETSVTVTAIRKEAKIALKEVDKVYNGNAQTYDFANITVHDDLYREITPFGEGKLNRTKLSRKDIGTQIPTATVNTSTTGSWYYQSETYGGQFTINDKEATVAPGAQTTVYGTTEQYEATKWTVDGKVGSVEPVSDLNVASQTDVYDRLDVYDGYEILVAGTENMNYNVKYKTDHNDSAKDAEDSKVTEYTDVVFKSMTRRDLRDLNDATVYGETPNALDWTLMNAQKTTRGTGSEAKDYADNLADFDLESIFVEQDYDNCVGNADCGKFDYKAANRTTEPKADYNKAVLDVVRTATDTAKDENYTLKFKTVTNSGASLNANNYKLTNDETGNATGTTKALKDGSLGFVPAAGESGKEGGENFVEGSANIAQRPVTVKKASTIDTVRLYWRLPQSKLYTALLNILEAEENTTNRGLAKGHTIKDLDLKIYVQDKLIDPNNDDARSDLIAGPAQVRIEVGDTNYVLDGNGKIDDVELKAIQIEATYTTKTATNFVVLIKIRNQDKSTTPLESAAGLTYEILRKVNGSFDGQVYASGSLTYTGRTATDKFGDECGVFTASYGPLSNIGGTYFIQMYEYGVALKTENS